MKNFLKFLTLVLIIFAFATSAFADTCSDEDGSIYIDFSQCQLVNKQIECQLYQVTDIDFYGRQTLESKFKDVDVDLAKLSDSSYWKNFAKNLENYINYKMIAADEKFTTDINGNYQLRNLDWGIYFIKVEDVRNNGCNCYFEPIMIMIGCAGNPSADLDDDFTIQPKMFVEPNKPDKPDTPNKDYNLYVEKIWKNTSSDSVILDVITVEIYRNGKLYKTVELSEKNMWKYSWTDSNKNNVWAVKELETMANFTTNYEKNAYKFTIINTYDKPDIPDKPDEPDDPDKPDKPDEPDTPEILIKTGYYGYLVPVFASIGAISILLGLILRRKTNAKNKF